mmetsp:Transcript_19456/g.51474  ORF Transcript_19456/g.51474 Transcript_19456/m.51474 type:complete len:242 (+) Transcript_19456:1549-2274(+)
MLQAVHPLEQCLVLLLLLGELVQKLGLVLLVVPHKVDDLPLLGKLHLQLLRGRLQAQVKLLPRQGGVPDVIEELLLRACQVLLLNPQRAVFCHLLLQLLPDGQHLGQGGVRDQVAVIDCRRELLQLVVELARPQARRGGRGDFPTAGDATDVETAGEVVDRRVLTLHFQPQVTVLLECRVQVYHGGLEPLLEARLLHVVLAQLVQEADLLLAVPELFVLFTLLHDFSLVHQILPGGLHVPL